MTYLKYTLLLFIPACFLACDTDVVIPIPSEANKPVINVLMNKDSIIYARITLSGRVVNPDIFVEPKDAVVQLFDNDQLKETLVLRTVGFRDYYCSTTKMEAGHTYRVTAAIPGQEIAEGTDVVPDTVVIGERKHIEIPLSGWKFENKAVIELKDKGGERNYYRIRIYGAFEYTAPDGTILISRQNVPTYFKPEDPTQDLFGGDLKNAFFTDDRLFDGRSPRFIFTLESDAHFDYLFAEVTTLTHHSYRYMQTSYVASLKYEDPLTEKVLVYNNIKNGLGIVGGVAVKEYLLTK
jgi:hypothetical protein